MATNTETPLAVIKDFYALLAKGDGPNLLALLNDRIEWTESERFPYYGGTWTTPAEVAEKLLGPASRDWSEFYAEADDYLTEGNRVVSTGRYKGVFRKTGAVLSAEFAHVWRVEGGKIHSFKMFADTAKILEAMGT